MIKRYGLAYLFARSFNLECLNSVTGCYHYSVFCWLLPIDHPELLHGQCFLAQQTDLPG